MVDKMVDRKKKELGISDNAGNISGDQFFKQAGIKVVKR